MAESDSIFTEPFIESTSEIILHPNNSFTRNDSTRKRKRKKNRIIGIISFLSHLTDFIKDPRKKKSVKIVFQC